MIKTLKRTCKRVYIYIVAVEQIKDLKNLCLSFNNEKFDLSYDQFRDVFTEALDNWEMLFKELKNESSKADIYQALCVLIIFSKSQFVERAIGTSVIRTISSL